MVAHVPNAADVVVRPALPADAGAIGRIHVASWRSTYAQAMDPEVLAGLDPVSRAEVWHQILSSGPHKVVVTERAGQVIGFASYGPARDADASGTTGEVHSIYVDPAVVGTGAGAALMNHAVADLATGFADAVLWVLEENLLARSFYERGGWRPDGVARDEELGGAVLHEIRYRRTLP